jgi:hypothetical protein
MSEVVTMVSAHIAPERIADVIDAFGAAVRAGMPERRHTSLYRGDGNLVRIVTVWRSREELEQYLSGVDRRRGFALALLERRRHARGRGPGTRPGQQHHVVAVRQQPRPRLAAPRRVPQAR